VNQGVNGWEIAVLAGWAIAIWMFFSVLFSESSKFSNLGKSKLRWFLLALAAFLPYIGFVFVFAYVLVVRVHFPPKPAAPPRPHSYPPPTGNSPGTGSSYKAPVWESFTPKVCRSCGGSGGLRYCGQCQNGWITGSNGALESCHAGCSYGKFYCNTCRGTGKA
jgi:hypothetical protein